MLDIAVAWFRKFLYPPPPIRAEELARHDLQDPERALKDSFTWSRERALRFVDGAFKTAALILTPLLAAIVDRMKDVGSATAGIYLVSAAAFSMLGIVWQARAAHLERSLYREAIKLAELKTTPQP
jgi:hypothetical protein